ncbi:unnamed protein product [Cylindrotheca closterium]|uniref:Uncharacterized protein n=1 Tax=Cylindrotheca closterium TaxID=2856 RepID=A0AAD2CM30_9STRA|nr:unnamed protein product [Cylindrotheca closterium]
MEKVVSFLSPTKGRRPRRIRSGQKSETTTPAPEIHRWVFLLFVKLLAPSTITFLASETPLTTILGVWYPIVFTFYLLQRQHPRVLFGKAKARTNEQRLWLHYWSMVASWQFLRRAIIDPALKSTFGFFFLLPWKMKQTILSCLAQAELLGYVLLLYPIIHSKTWDGTIRLTTAQWNHSSVIYRMWDRHILSKIVTTEATTSLLSSALASFSLAPSPTIDKDKACDALSPSEYTPEEQQHPSDVTSAEEKSYWSYLERICEKAYQLVTQMISLAQWFGFISEDTVASAKALWSKVRRLPAGLVLPPLFLAVMPINFCAQLGLQYLQWFYAASFSLKAASMHNTKDIAGNRNQGKQCEETYWLQYWIVHSTFVFGGLDYVSSQLPSLFKGLILWNFWLTLAWIWLLHDSLVVQSMFDILAAELVGLGLVADEVDDSKSRYKANGQSARQRPNVSETKTARFAQYILQQLPRASPHSDTERENLVVMEQNNRKSTLEEDERSSCGDSYPDLTEASSSLSSTSSVSYSTSSSPVPSSNKQSVVDSSAQSSTTGDFGTPMSVKDRRKRLLLRYRQQRSKQSSPV